MITIKNEVVNYLNTGARADFFHVKETAASIKIDFLEYPPKVIESVVVNIYSQEGGDLIKSYEIDNPASPPQSFFTWVIADTDFAAAKPLNYWVKAVDQDKELLFYGSFTLQA
jgi:hypothetical protein